MQSKNKKIIALGLATTALVGTVGNNLFAINSVADDESYIDNNIDTLAVAPNKPSIVMKDNELTLVDNGISSITKDDFKSTTSPFKYSNAKWRTTGGVMRSEIITHGQSTENTFEINTKDGDVLNVEGSVSSEDYYDIATILIDDEVVYEGYGARVPFNIKINLTAGKHKVTFRYQKDGSGSEYEDCLNINSISLISKTNSKQLKYRIDGGAWKTYTSKVLLDFNAKESYLIEAKAIASDGTESAIVSRTVKKAVTEIQAPDIISRKKGFLLKDNGVKTFSIKDTFDTTNNISYSNNKWTTGSGKMVSEAIGFGETTTNKFTITAEEGDILNIKGLINSDLSKEVGKIYLNDNLIYSTKATKGFNFEYELPEGTHEVKLEYTGTYGNQSVNSMVIDEISVATKLNSDKLQYRIDGGSWKDYTNPVELDYKVKDSYVIETKSVYKNNSSSITKETLTKRQGVVKAPTITVKDNKVSIKDNGYTGTVLYDDFTFNSDFNYSNPDWVVKNNQFHSPVVQNMWDSTLVEFNVNLSKMATFKLLGSQNSKDGSDTFTLYVDNLPISSTSNNLLDIKTDIYEGKHKIGLEFSKNSSLQYNYKGIIDLIEFEGNSTAKEILYKIDNGQWTKYTGEININFGSEKTRKVYAKAIGFDGSESAIVEQTVTNDDTSTNPDPTPPTDTNSKTEDLQVAVKAKNTLEMSVSTNTITFGNYNGTQDFTNNDLNITVSSGLNYDITATMMKNLTSERGDIMSSNLLNVKEFTKKDYNIFQNIGDKLFLVQNSPAGRDNIHNIHFKLLGDSSVKAGNYKTTIQFETIQK